MCGAGKCSVSGFKGGGDISSSQGGCTSARGDCEGGEAPEGGEKGPVDGLLEGAGVGKRGELPHPPTIDVALFDFI